MNTDPSLPPSSALPDCPPRRETPATATLIRAFLEENFVLAHDLGQELTPTASLSALGLIDSTGVLELIAFLEQTFRITVRDAETLPENLDSIERIVGFVERKQQESP